MKRLVIAATTLLVMAAAAIVFATAWTTGRSAGGAGTATLTASHSQSTPHYYLSISTPDMLGGTEDTGPAYVPSNFSLPANTDVTLTIVNFDGATALTPDYAKYATASGIKGAMTVSDLDSVHPNAIGATRTATSLDPASGVSHTFTIAKLGLNVPLAPQSRTTFTFHTGAAGVYDWRCMDPCGTGPAGWGAAMTADGFMQGKVTFN